LGRGATLTPCNVSGISITNKSDAKCEGDVRYELSGSTNNAGTVKGYAVATCNNNPSYKLDSIVATVVSDPTFTSACEWTSASGRYPAGSELSTSYLKTPPVLASISNNYGRCTEFVFSTDGTSAYGNLPNTVGTVVSGIKLYAKCGTQLVGGSTCPNITTKNPTECSSCIQYCSEETCGRKLIINGISQTYNPPPTGGVCLHFDSASKLNFNNNSQATINGENVLNSSGANKCYSGNSSCLPNQADEGGWYLFIQSGYADITVGTGHDVCPPELICNMPLAINKGSQLNALQCTAGAALSNQSYTSTPQLNQNNLAEGNYTNITGSGTCGTTTGLQAVCGNLEVTDVTSISIGYSQYNNNNNAFTTPANCKQLDANKTYQVSFTGNDGGVLICTGTGATGNVGTINGTPITLGSSNHEMSFNSMGVTNNSTNNIVKLTKTLTCCKSW